MIQYIFVDLKKEISSEYLDNISTEIVDSINAELIGEYPMKENVLFFQFQNNAKHTCDLILELSTFNQVKQLMVQINFENPEEDSLQNFNDLAYDLKVKVKDILRRDWIECIWLKDSQSAQFAEQLYSKVYSVENRLREFINLIMINSMGVKWWETYVSSHLQDTFNNRRKDYGVVAPLYKNVDARLLSINTDHLTDIMTFKLKSWQPQFNEDIEKLVFSEELKDLRSLQGKLREQFVTKVDLWESLFSKYFDDTFLNNWSSFCKNRNHIAHNKLIDKRAYQMILESANTVFDKIESAFQTYHEQTQSDELKEEILRTFMEYEVEIMEAQAGIEINSAQNIQNQFCEELLNIDSVVEDAYHFRNDINITESNVSDAEEQQFLCITSSLSDKKIILQSEMILDGEPGATSNTIIKVFLETEEGTTEKFTYEMTYQNGDAGFDPEQGTYMPIHYNELNEIDYNQLLLDLEELISTHFPDKVAEIASWDREGGLKVVGDFECEECGHETVSIHERFHEIGTCVSCGQNQADSLNNCARCEEYYNFTLDGDRDYCEECSQYIESQ